MAELSLPERLVHAAETALEEAADTTYTELSGATSVEGLLLDLAKAAVAAAFEERAADLASRGFTYSAVECSELAAQVRDVPAVKAV